MPVAVNSHMAAVLGTGDRTELVELGILPAEPTAMPVGLTSFVIQTFRAGYRNHVAAAKVDLAHHAQSRKYRSGVTQ